MPPIVARGLPCAAASRRSSLSRGGGEQLDARRAATWSRGARRGSSASGLALGHGSSVVFRREPTAPRPQGSTQSGEHLAAGTWSAGRTRELADPRPATERDHDVLHLHRLEGDDRIAAATVAPTATWTVEDRARHRRDDLGRAGPPAVRGPPRLARRARRRGPAPAGRRRSDRRGRRWTVSPARTAGEAGSDRPAATSTVRGHVLRRDPDRPGVQPPAAGPWIAPGPPSASELAAAGCRTRRPRGIVACISAARVGRPDPVERVDPRLARRGRPAGGRASAGSAGSWSSPSTTVVVERARQARAAPRPDRDPRRRSWRASGRTGRRPRCRARSRHRPGCPRRSASGAPRSARSPGRKPASASSA